MRSRTVSTTILSAGLLLALGACTSGGDEPDPSTDDAAVTSDDGLEGTAGNRGWMCQYVSPEAVESAAGGSATTPRMLITEDTEDAWVCDVLVGGAGEQEPVLRLAIQLGEEAREAARTRAQEADGMEPGPDHLGVSFRSPGLVTGLTLCTSPGGNAEDPGDKIPYTLVAESLGETDEATTDLLQRALTETAKGLDQSVGCSPKQALADQS